MSDEPIEDWDAYVLDFGIRLHRARTEAAMTQEDLAHAAGITRSHYQQLEKGLSRPGKAANPSLRTIAGLASVLGLQPHDLIPHLGDQHPQTDQNRAAS